MVSKLLTSLFLVLPFVAFSMVLDPVLKKELSRKNVFDLSSRYGDQVKVLLSNGEVKVLNLMEALSIEGAVYLEAPRKLRPLMNIVRNSSLSIKGDGNISFTINTKEGQRLNIIPYGISSISFSGACSGSISDLSCQRGTLNVNVNATSDFGLLLSSDNTEIRVEDVVGVESLYVGVSASLSGKTGRGVVIAIIDTGINPCHPAFLNPDGATRILYMYIPKTDTEMTSTEIENDIALGKCKAHDTNGHGTHVAGIAAGGEGSSPYRGIAPEADLIVVKLIDFTDSEIIKALDYLRDKLITLGKPIVVNMSLGGHFGPHDGSSLLSRAVDNAVSDGLVIVVAAGNEGDMPIHAQIASISAPVKVNFTTYTTGDAIDGWYKGGRLDIKFCKNTTCIQAFSGSVISGRISGCSVYIDNSIVSSPLNGDGEFYVDYDCSGNFYLELSPASGSIARVDLYFACPMCYSEFKNFVRTDSLGGVVGTVGIPGTSKKAITVGAITSKPIRGSSTLNIKSLEDLGEIAFFSSRGPTRDGRVKPDISAGGFFVFSASNDGSSYIPNAGTSMSTPVVSGLAALILETTLNTAFSSLDLNATKVKDTLINNALVDSSVGIVPNNAYGYGKAHYAVSFAPSDSGGGSGGSDANTQSSGSGGGCNTFQPLTSPLIAILILILLRRRKG